jgi:hypothetical protein
MLKELEESECLKLLSLFSCPKNPDVETFLRDKSIRFEKSDNARTYLILNSENGEILDYFSLSFKEITLLANNVSKSLIKKFDGISKNAENVRVYLIGQIGKNFAIDENPINLGNILSEAFSIIDAAKALIGGRGLILECEDSPALIQHYKNHGFEQLLIDNSNELVTMYTFVQRDDN